MPADLYYMDASAPCRTVIMTARQLGVPLNLKVLNLMAGEHMKEDYLKINPQHCIPTLVEEDGFALWESRAIAQYLCNKHAPDSDLYPTELRARARVDRILNFDLGVIGKATGEFIYPQLLRGEPANEEKREIYSKAMDLLDKFLDGNEYVAGTESLTIADLSVLSSLGYAVVLDYDFTAHSNVSAWMDRLAKELPYHEEVNVGPLKKFKEHIAQRAQKSD